ncbi:MAG: HEAT repeat domain-containing protein [Rubrivivax sp.]|nr:HEAT repeat domain-containing protein [Rubrivivax sp.]
MALRKAAPGAPATAVLRRVEPREYARQFDGLCAQLGDADAGVRRWAARDLAEHPGAARMLAARLAAEADTSVRAVILSSLARIGGPAAVDALLPLLRSEDAMLRNGAIEALAGLPDAVAPRIEALLADPDGDVRIFSVNLLGLLPHPRVPQWLAQVLERETEANVVGAALDVLAEVGGPELAGPLRRTLARFAGEPYIRFAAELALQRIESP